ncbi:COQ9 family protein [Falsirhodobacter halotolerans]|uniref:COQ9 family protein n=1 Tax=Falsirhodobacter halotolerans TaxID=1146892 RepID=UPI001FD5CE83|nr:COQ9 family protein [Falsirhodobacter halotolerans]MCJ8138641.1 COQ9 family protein [Falsirhodobacter halotolerans]
MDARQIRDAVIDAALGHVAFDGWTETTLRAAIADAGVDPVSARAQFPRGAVDLALAYHARGDAAMVDYAKGLPADLGISGRVAAIIRRRLELADREAVRRASTLFALPHHAGDGARALWGTSDAIWRALGDTSEDVNWYTKRATLSGVYAATVLFWLGDDSGDHHATWDFLNRRIADVMKIEGVKARARKNPLVRAAMLPFSVIRAPGRADDMPGRMS